MKRIVYAIVVGLISLGVAYLPLLLNTPKEASFTWLADQLAMLLGLVAIVLIFKAFDYALEKDQEKPD